MQNLVVVFHTVCTHVGPKNFEDVLLGPCPFGTGACLTPDKHTTAPRVIITNFVTEGQTVSVYVGSLGTRAWLMSYKHAPAPVCYHTKFRHSRSNRLDIIMEICQKILTPCSPPFKVSLGHCNRHQSLATYDFLLMFHSNYRPILYRLRDTGKGDNCKIFYISRHHWGVPLEILSQQWELIYALLDRQNSVTICPFV